MEMEYLKKRIPGFKLIENIEEVDAQLPLLWKEILSEDTSNRRNITIQIWKNYFESELSNTLRFFKSNLLNIDLINSNKGLSLLYTFELEGNYLYREGRIPSINDNPKIESVLKQTPENFQSFYSNFHNGWFEVSSRAMGFLPYANMKILNDEDLDINENYGLDLSKILTIFSNAGGGYLCFNLLQTPPNGLIWWNDDKPNVDVNFWDVFDEWCLLGLTD